VEIYQNEEEQLEALKRWWKENGKAALTGVAMGILIIIAWHLWQDYRQDRQYQAAALYESLTQALNAKEESEKARAQALIERLRDDFSGTHYAHFATLFTAKQHTEQQDYTGARQTLERFFTEAPSELKDIARLRLARLSLASGEYEQGLQWLERSDPPPAPAFTSLIEELKGDLYLALDRVEEARTAYQTAQRQGSTSPLLSFKLDDVATPTQPE